MANKIFEKASAVSDLTIWTLDWVPEGPRGFVRDLRLRWACEEADLAYAVRSVPFEGRETNHLARQPFGQVPFLTDGELEIFESGAVLLHLARKSDKLMPSDPIGEAETLQWTIAAINSIEMVSVPWWFLEVTGAKDKVSLNSGRRTRRATGLLGLAFHSRSGRGDRRTVEAIANVASIPPTQPMTGRRDSLQRVAAGALPSSGTTARSPLSAIAARLAGRG